MKTFITTLFLYLCTCPPVNNCLAQVSVLNDLIDSSEVTLHIDAFRPTNTLSKILLECIKGCRTESLKRKIAYSLQCKKDGDSYRIDVYPTMDAGYLTLKKAYGEITMNDGIVYLFGAPLPTELAVGTKAAMLKTVARPPSNGEHEPIPNYVFDPQGPLKLHQVKAGGVVYRIYTQSCK